MPNDWLSEIAAEMTPEMFHEGFQPVAEVCGVEAALRLAQQMGGGRIYVPKFESLIRERRDARIRAEFTGFNHRELARRYRLSESWIRQVLGRKPAHETAELFTEAGRAER